MESENRPTDPRIRGIVENRDALLDALDVNSVLLTELSGHGILDERTRQRITSEKKYVINERFIEWLETGTSQTIDIVLQKLRDDKQDHVANLIDGAEGIPDAISSFCFTNMSVLYWSSLVIIMVHAFIMNRQNPRKILAALCIMAYYMYYLKSSDPGVGVGRYCQEDKCVYLFRWEYLSDNMRINEAVEQVPAQNYNGAGGLFKSPAAFAVWNKYTSHIWDEKMLEYTQGSQFIREVYTKPLVGTHSFHLLTVFRLSTDLVSAGHGSLFYDDPMLTLCLLDANGNTVKSFGRGRESSKGVPMVLDADREGCIIIADHISGKTMTLCSDNEQMKRFQDQIQKGNRPLEMCLGNQQF